ncbi:MAG: biotin--[acetyl-CoA-carboxylase] ligase [Candidatus Algichlamydia australiensis]|nr:biotin--[acetyl-CoA-carboxylase] ligase [Chlamydiales bacterium]
MQVEKILFETIDSTNKWAKEHLTELKPDTLYVVRAEEQTMGYGRRGHDWISPKGKNLLLTLALLPESPALLTHRMCLSLAKTLEEYSLQPRIKWPNDLFLNGKKIAGVLCEIQNGIAYLGLGLNVNMEKQVDFAATSLLIETGKEFDRDEVEQKIIANFLKTAFEKTPYEERMIFLNQTITIEDEGKWKKGICKGINENGALLLMIGEKTLPVFTGRVLPPSQGGL